MKLFDGERRRLPPLLGAVIFVVAMVVAFTRPFEEEPPVQVSTAATTSTTSTTTPTSTTILVLNGVPFAVPVPSLPPHITTLPGPEGGVVNIHRRITVEDICADPELLRSFNEASVPGGFFPPLTCPTTTTTTRR